MIQINSLRYFSTLANKLYNVDDISGVQGFDDGSTSGSSSQEYTYDANGNMTEDLNKNIDIVYNFLNLPEKVYFPDWYNCSRLSFDYDAAGNKVRMLVEQDCGSQEEPDCTVEEEIHYVGNFVYVDNTLAYILNGHGRIVKSSSEFIYEYSIIDHLGNVRVVFNEEGTSGANPKQYADYYPFGMRFTGTYLNNDNRYLYNSKELEDNFELNWYDYGARFYDPALGRWHTPDPKAEMVSYMSPYAGIGNNPVNYIDPDGEFFLGTIFTYTIDFIKTAFFKGGLDITSKKAMGKAWKDFDPTAPWSQTNKAWKIDIGGFKTDENRTIAGRSLQLLSRWTWEIPQTILGKTVSHTRNISGNVDRVDYFGGATFVTSTNQDERSGVSIGNYINIKITDDIVGDFEDRVITDPLFMHEYGHTFDSQIFGLFYLPVIGLPSIISAGTAKQVRGEPYGVSTHRFRWYEMRANRHAARYFNNYYGVDWDPFEIFHPRKRR